ncbi:MAG: phosphoribosylglycinamide formyltransferase [Candidatus Gracilibacteria bacterium]|nr:phosphoribosylglycinamide formyltransferase [Candidatus Gracilibacteria bacterium]MDD5179242.1 phosphoribosylglycinamide formyltransferase [Candidatus Gracilibacteria bacterium]
MPKTFRVVILASTRGTDFSAMLEEKNAGKLKGVEFVGLVSNKPCLAAEKAEAANIPTFVLDAKSKDFQDKLLATVKELQPDLICLVGYMRILREDFCKAFENKILNIHPSLLPKYAGGMDLNVYEEVLKNKETETGMSIHLVTPVVDGGAIICQKSVAIADGETPESLKEKVQQLEKKWYPEVIRWFRDGKIYF